MGFVWGLATAGGPTRAAEAKKSLAPLYPIQNAIKIDGNVTDWEWAPSLGIGKLAHTISIAEHGTVARFLARYDAEYLYVAFRVTDSSPALNKWLQQDRWQGDQVELLLCTDPKEHPKHGSFSKYDYQFFIGPSREGRVDVYVNINGEKRAYAVPGSEAALAVWPDKKGYDVEAKIPWASLNRPDYFQPKPGVEIGWQIQIDFSTPDGERFAYAAKWHPFGIHFQHLCDRGWRDTNGDGLPQLDEYRLYTKQETKSFWRTASPHNYYVDARWNIQNKVDEEPGGRYIEIPFGGFDRAGNPIYSWSTVRLVFERAKVDPAWTADLSGGKPARPQLGGIYYAEGEGVFLVLNDRPEFVPRDCRFRAYTPSGKRLFSIGRGTSGFWDKPGEEISFCMQMTAPIGDFVFLTDTPGAVHVFTRNGLYAGTLCEQGDSAPELLGKDPRIQPMGEMWYAHLFRHPRTHRVYLIAEPNTQHRSPYGRGSALS